MEADVLDPCRRKDLLVSVPEGVRIVHRPRLGRGEHIRAVRVLLVFQNKQVHRLLRDGDGTDRVAGFGLAHLELTIDAVHLLCHGDRHVLHIKISPEESQQFAPPQATGQLQVVRWKQATPVGLLEIGSDLLRQEHLHLFLLNLGELAPFRRVGGDEPLPYRLLQRRVEKTVDTSNEAVAQALVLQLNVLIPLDTT